MIVVNDKMNGRLPWYTSEKLFVFLHLIHFGWIQKAVLWKRIPETTFTFKKLFIE
jgi:hypothetical protein